MEKTYHAQPDKANKYGYSSEYTWITVENGEAIGCARGDWYAGCSCRKEDRPRGCTDECAANCIEMIVSCLSEEDAAKVRGVRFKEQTATEVKDLTLKEERIRAVKLKEIIETACKYYGMNLTIYDGKIGFVDPGSKKIVMLWGAEYKMNVGDEGNGKN